MKAYLSCHDRVVRIQALRKPEHNSKDSMWFKNVRKRLYQQKALLLQGGKIVPMLFIKIAPEIKVVKLHLAARAVLIHLYHPVSCPPTLGAENPTAVLLD